MVPILRGPIQLGTTDLLLGLIAALSNELRSRVPSQPVAIEPRWLFQRLVILSHRAEYTADLRYLEEGSFLDLLFLTQCWGTLNVENGGRAICMGNERAWRNLGRIGRHHGLVTVHKLRFMANELLTMPSTAT
jgi:hypothetical protein